MHNSQGSCDLCRNDEVLPAILIVEPKTGFTRSKIADQFFQRGCDHDKNLIPINFSYLMATVRTMRIKLFAETIFICLGASAPNRCPPILGTYAVRFIGRIGFDSHHTFANSHDRVAR